MDDPITTDGCTLPTEQRPLRLAEFESLFTEALRRVQRDGDAVRMHLAGEPGLVDRVRDLAEREMECCSFFTFLIEGSDDNLVLEISVPPDRRDILVALTRRAEELAS